jgi:hypothetical protein
MSILSINSTVMTNSVDNTGITLCIKKGNKFLVNNKHAQFTPISVMANRYDLVNDYEKAIIILRHSIRPSSVWADNVKLTDLGVYTANQAGTQLSNIDTKIQYFSTNITRTKQTAFEIYKGRNNVLDDTYSTEDDIPLISSAGITDLNFIEHEDKYDEYVSVYGYNAVWYDYIYGDRPIIDGSTVHHSFMDAFYDIDTVSNAFISSAINATEKISVIISHDQNIMPLVASKTNYLINFKKSNKWLNYLSGLLILKKAGALDPCYVPITGLATGYN